MAALSTPQPYSVEFRGNYWIGRFSAMASPCEILYDLDETDTTAEHLTSLAFTEAQRIEQKFSRYRDDNIVYRINHANGASIELDLETTALLNYAEQCYVLSDGMFDITSGILRRVWRFDGNNHVPTRNQVSELLGHISWAKVEWTPPLLKLPAGMELDFGGIGKEYAVDKTAQLLRQHTDASLLVNFGGDLVANGLRRNGQGWMVGLEDPDHIQTGITRTSSREFELIQGAIATSGDSRRFILHKGIRYSHILDPRTGWPVQGSPRSVSVLAATCTEAGIIATLAMLHGSNAEAFLRKQQLQFWSQR